MFREKITMALPADWVDEKCEQTYHDTLVGKWSDVRNKIWQTTNGMKYKIDATNFATVLVVPTTETSDNINNGARTTKKRHIVDEPQIALLNKKFRERTARAAPTTHTTHTTHARNRTIEQVVEQSEESEDQDIAHGFGDV